MIKLKVENSVECCYCETLIVGETVTREHLVPSSVGGNNSEYNIKPCCLKCNKLRKNKPLFVFRFQLKRSLKNGNLYKGFTVEETTKAIKNTYKIEKYIKENLHLLMR